jgi:hypothetical protein
MTSRAWLSQVRMALDAGWAVQAPNLPANRSVRAAAPPTGSPPRVAHLTVDSADNDRMMLRAAVLLASVSLVMALPAAGSEAAVAKSVTIRVLVMPVTRTIKDVPPKTFKVTGEWSKGDTFSGTSILRNAVSQFGKPKGARIGTSSFTDIALSSQMVRTDGVARLPGGTLHIRGVAPIGPTVKLPVVGGTGIYAGATGVVEGRHLANGDTLDVCRLQVP